MALWSMLYSPSFPVGAFSYSSGIEWAVEAGDVSDAESLRDWLTSMLVDGAGVCDGIFLVQAYRSSGNATMLPTVAELAVIGRPAILVPLPQSLDGDQAANAVSLEAIGAATVIRQADFTPDRLSAELATRLADPASLIRAAAAARGAGLPDAAQRLAACVLRLAGQTQEIAA